MYIRKTCLFIVFVLGSINLAFAHPHVAIDTHPVFVFDNGYFKGVSVTWTWDEFFSDQVIVDYDKNENDKFEPEELAKVEEFFHNIKDYSYFSEIKINGQDVAEIKIEQFSAKINPFEYTLTYTFFIPVNFKLTDGDMIISYINNDPTIYISFSTECTAEGLDEETKNVDIFDSSVKNHSYYGYQFMIVAHKK
ncbi:MAG: DUF1007 family protein [Endomicrobiales bacterium]|nr:DUF1007 family protein [Endomicrobiales bacterium]